MGDERNRKRNRQADQGDADRLADKATYRRSESFPPVGSQILLLRALCRSRHDVNSPGSPMASIVPVAGLEGKASLLGMRRLVRRLWTERTLSFSAGAWLAWPWRRRWMQAACHP